MYDNAKLFTEALGIQKPWKVDEVKFDPKEKQLDIYISNIEGIELLCPDCKQESAVHDHTDERAWRHLNFFEHQAYIHSRIPRVLCGKCASIKQVTVPWARPRVGLTLLFEALVMELAAHIIMHIKDIYSTS